MSRYYEEEDDYRGRRSSSRTRRDSRGPSQDAYSDAYMSSAGGRLQPYNHDVAYYPPSASNPDFGHGGLQSPSSGHRHHSMPPDQALVTRRRSSRSSGRDGDRSPMDKTKHAVDNTFSTSGSGIGVGVIGAIVGGLAAREATEAAARARDKRHGEHGGEHNHDRAALISTIVGAAVGGLGANALEKRHEHKHKDRKRRNHQGGTRELNSGDSDSDWDESASRGSRGSRASRRSHRSNRERGLVISRSPSPGEREQARGGAADDYYSYDRKSSRRSDDGYR